MAVNDTDDGLYRMGPGQPGSVSAVVPLVPPVTPAIFRGEFQSCAKLMIGSVVIRVNPGRSRAAVSSVPPRRSHN